MNDNLGLLDLAHSPGGAFLLDAIREGVLVVDATHTVVFANRRAIALLERPLDEVLPLSLERVLIGAGGEAAAALRRALAAPDETTGAPVRIDLAMAGGRVSPLQVTVRHWSSTTTSNLLILLSEPRSATDTRVARLEATLDEHGRRLRRALHDFNNAFAILQGRIEILLADTTLVESNSSLRRHLSVAHEAAIDAAEIMRRLPEEPASAADSNVTEAVAGGLDVLAVDDEEQMLETLTEMLELDGHRVRRCHDAEEALRELERATPDLVLTDLGMPGSNGLYLAAQVARLSPSTPVILATGWGARVSPDEQAAAHVHLVLSKPFDLAMLRRAIASTAAR